MLFRSKPDAEQKASRVAQETPLRRLYKECEVTVLSAARVGLKWKDPTWGWNLEAKEGEEIFVVRFRIRPIGLVRSVQLKGFAVRTTDGATGKSQMETLEPLFDRRPVHVFALPFAIPQGKRVDTFLIEDLAFDLTKLPPSKKSK